MLSGLGADVRVFFDTHEANRRRVLDHKSVQLGGLIDGRDGATSEVLLLVFAGDWILVAEDEVNLGGAVRACTVDTYEAQAKLTLVPGQVRSGPNMTTQGVLSENSLGLAWKPSSRSLMYPPPQFPPFWYFTSY